MAARSKPAKGEKRVRKGARGPFRAGFAALKHWYFDGCGQLAAAIAYYGLLSFFPFLLVLAQVAVKLLATDDPVEVRRFLSSVRAFAPTFDDQSWDLVQGVVEGHGAWSLLSLLVVVFLASRVVHSARESIARIFDPARSPARARGVVPTLISILLTAVSMAVLGFLFVMSSVVELFLRVDVAPGWLNDLLENTGLIRHAVPTLALVAVGFIAYRHAPGHRPGRRHALEGAALFGIGTHLAVVLHSRGVGAILERDLVYGSFVGIITFLAWVWFVAALLLLGAELVAVLEGMRDEE